MDQSIIKKFEMRENLYLINPHLNEEEKLTLLRHWKEMNLSEHIFLCSSGTSSGTKVKSYAISYDSLFNNARAVNEFIKGDQNDTWLLSLPYYHIGGLSILARCFLEGQEYLSLERRWDPFIFMKFLQSNLVHFISLVPTQVFDVVNNQLSCPPHVKGVFVGGDFLSNTLAEMAFKLGWPIIKTYGMTEVCSQIASSFWQSSNNGFLQVLNAHNVHLRSDEVFISSSCMYSYEMILDNENFLISKAPKLLPLPDRVEVLELNNKVFIKPLGRIGSEFKSKGRLYNFFELKERVDKILIKYKVKNNVELCLKDHDREGKVLEIVSEESVTNIHFIIEEINNAIPKSIKIDDLKVVPALKRTSIGKFKK